MYDLFLQYFTYFSLKINCKIEFSEKLNFNSIHKWIWCLGKDLIIMVVLETNEQMHKNKFKFLTRI